MTIWCLEEIHQLVYSLSLEPRDFMMCSSHQLYCILTQLLIELIVYYVCMPLFQLFSYLPTISAIYDSRMRSWTWRKVFSLRNRVGVGFSSKCGYGAVETSITTWWSTSYNSRGWSGKKLCVSVTAKAELAAIRHRIWRKPLLSRSNFILYTNRANKSIIAGSTGNIPSETAAGEGGDGENRGRRNRSTWSGRESRPSVPQKKRERVTEQSQRVNYPRPLRAYNIHEEGSVL